MKERTAAREFRFVLLALTILYWLAIAYSNRRYVWFDELFTFDIARASSIEQLWHWEVHFDNHTPTAYLLSRLSMALFGPTPLGLRLPSMLEFYFGSLAILFYVRRKANLAFAALAVLLVWAVAPTLYYAVEARSYALIFLAFSWLLLSWDTAIRSQPRNLALFGVALSTFTLTVAHMFAPFTLLAFVCAEMVRSRRRRRPDYPLWIALLAPMSAMLIYIPLLPAAQTIISAVSASPRTMIAFYQNTMDAPILILVLLVLFLTPGKSEPEKATVTFLPEEQALFLFLLLNPVWLNLALGIRHGTFYDRYCLTTEVALMIGLAILLSRRTTLNPRAVYAASLILAFFIGRTYITQPRSDPTPRNAAFLAAIHPELPIVAGEGQVFAEMNHYESPQILSRLYYLKDRQASLDFSHTNFFQDFEAPDAMQAAGFPYAAHIASYREFVLHHRQFLLLSSPQRYVFAKLRSEGATFTYLGNFQGSMPYLDTTLYLVTLPTE